MLSQSLCLLLTVGVAFSDDSEFKIVQLSHGGSVQGKLVHSGTSRYESYLGIPYGNVPLRFAPPIPHPGWKDVRKATEEGPVCFQRDYFPGGPFPRNMDEECLVLNVFTPDSKTRKKLPVMVFIHGGGFMTGSSTTMLHGADYLMAPGKNIVLVTIHYRVGALGFLSTGDSEAPGNWGMLDQVEALRWIQKNIPAFGGDANSVTVFGESAGGASVSLLLLSPLAAGLFHRGIAQSGSAMDSWAIQRKPEDSARRLAEGLGCKKGTQELSSKDIIRCLREKPAKEVTEATGLLEEWGFLPFVFVPTVDSSAERPFLPDEPAALLGRGEVNRVPVMTGVTEEEGTFLSFTLQEQKDKFDNLEKNWNEACRTLFSLHLVPNHEEVCGKIRESFFGLGRKIDVTLLRPLAKALGERMFEVGNWKLITALAEIDVPTFAYSFEFKGLGSLGKAMKAIMQHLRKSQGDTAEDHSVLLDAASHGDDIAYLFSGLFFPKFEDGSEDASMLEYMTNIWTTFAREGSPASATDNQWTAWTIKNPGIYVIDTHSHLSYAKTNQHTVEFWDALLPSEPTKPQEFRKQQKLRKQNEEL